MAYHDEASSTCYGPKVWSTAARIREPNVTSIGRPIANTRVYIMGVSPLPGQKSDAVFMSPAPVGVAGEICIGGAGVSLGRAVQVDPQTDVERACIP
jgi:non-ribosomal peptide synthetase component F